MSRKTGAVISAVITLVIFVIFPLYLPDLLPPDMMLMVSNMGFDLEGLLGQIATIGVVMALITLLKGFVERTSVAYLILSAGSSIVTLMIIIQSVGLGDMQSMGVTTISLEVEGGVNTAVIDMRLFVQLAIALVALQIVQSILEFRDARVEEGRRQLLHDSTMRATVENRAD
jgi:hypothetical protein